MDYWERLFLYNKKLLVPRINRLLNWVMGVNFLCGVIFLLTIVYEWIPDFGGRTDGGACGVSCSLGDFSADYHFADSLSSGELPV